jgi:peptide/nickel transport system permease protein
VTTADVDLTDGVSVAQRRAARRRGVATASRFLAGRLAQGVFVVIGAVFIGFILVNLSGHGLALRGGGLLTPDQIEELRNKLGYDKPLLSRLWPYLGDVLRGDFGESYRFHEPAMNTVLKSLPNTLVLVGGGLGLALAIAVPSAVYSAIHQGRLADKGLRSSLSFLQGVPEFWLGLMLVWLLSVKLPIFPSVGYDGGRSVVLPIVALALPIVPALFRLLRGELLNVMNQDFVEALRIKGFPDSRIVRTHALRNAMPGFLTFTTLQLGYLLGGTILVEVVFGWPGMGGLAVDAARSQDVAVVEAVVVVLAIAYVLLNLLADLLVLVLDPRVRTGRL